MTIKMLYYVDISELFESDKELEEFLERVDKNVSYGDAAATLINHETMVALAEQYGFKELVTELNKLGNYVHFNFES